MALVPVFVEVVRQGSFTRAGAVLELPKSTVSRRVSRLEDALGVQLMVRTTRSLRLTEAGERFYARVAPALERVEEAARELAEYGEEPRGDLRITVPTDLDLLPRAVASFIERHPHVSVDVQVSNDLVDLVTGGFDLAVRGGRLDDSSLVARRLVAVEFQLFAAESYVRARGEPETVADLAGHACVLFRPQRGVSRWALAGPGGVEHVEVRGPVAVDDLTFASGLVLAGAGIGLLPAGIFGDARHRVRRLLPRYAMPRGAVHIVYPAARHVPAKVRAFRDHLLEHVALHEG